jgi:hypothetical protein
MQKPYQLIAALLLTLGIGQGAQSVAVSGAIRGASTLPAGAPFSAMANGMRAELRLHSITLPSSGTVALVVMGNRPGDYGRWGQITIDSAGNLCARNAIDNMSSYGGIPACVSLGVQTDVIVRWSRTPTGSTTGLNSIEVWDTATGARGGNDNELGGRIIDNFNSLNMASAEVVVNSADTFGTVNFATNGGSASIAWFKWHSTSLGTNAAIPKQTDAADLLDLRFEGNGNDDSGRGLTMAFTGGTATYAATPALAPIAIAKTASAPSWATWLSCRAMQPCQLSGLSSFSDALSFSYFWTQISGPSTGIWDSRTSSNPNVYSLIAGTYTFRLTVTDDVGLSGASDVTIGVVATDDNAVVISQEDSLKKVIGDVTRFGASAWPYLDNRQKAFADWYGSRIQSTGDWAPTWRNFLPGTVSVSANGLVVTGVGTNFAADVNCTGADHDFIVIRYPDAGVIYGASPGYRYRMFYPASCTATTATAANEFNGAWDGPDVAPGASYSKISTAEYYRWVAGGDNVNYYDNVLAHYAMYYRSGNTVYRDYARSLADSFIETPGMDYYRVQGTGANPYQVSAPRVRAAAGIMLRAIDGRPDLWEFLWDFFSTSATGFPTQTLGIDFRSATFFSRDMRENAYYMSFAAVAHMLWPASDPNQTTRKTYLADLLNTAITIQWVPLQRSNFGQSNYFQDRLFGNGSSTATVTNGSTTVTAVSGTFDAGICSGTNTIWFTTSYQLPIADPRSYPCTWVSSTQLTLGVAYQGTTGTKSYGAELLNSPGTQPFMMGLLANALWHTWQATGNTTAQQLILNVTNWIQVMGWRASSKGLYYVRDSVDCEPNPEAIQFCIDANDFSDQSTREFAAEVIGGMGRAYSLDPSISGLATRIDTHTGALFGEPGYGGPETSDGFVGASLGLPGNLETSRLGKYYGFYFGFGFDATWDAARIGGLAPADPVTVGTSVAALSGETGAPSVIYTSATAATETVPCTAGTSGWYCPGAGDRRLGTEILAQVVRQMPGGELRGERRPVRIK